MANSTMRFLLSVAALCLHLRFLMVEALNARAADSPYSARQLVLKQKILHLSSIVSQSMSQDVAKYPFSAIALYTDECPSSGSPIVMLSHTQMTMHNLADNKHCSALIRTEGDDNISPVFLPRVTLFGRVELLDDKEFSKVKSCFLNAHPEAQRWLDFHGYHLYHLQVDAVYYDAGFGERHFEAWIDLPQYRRAHPYDLEHFLRPPQH
eukprot:GILJ01014601.1.p1 GENE.GILJ01014601.1~~GILJ01014601.1.p1  ORF type:complete len:222 (-),score=18.33 GILJ01014601.1:44-667(-)